MHANVLIFSDNGKNCQPHTKIKEIVGLSEKSIARATEGENMTQSENPVVKFLRGKHDEYGLFCRLLLSALNQGCGCGAAITIFARNCVFRLFLKS